MPMRDRIQLWHAFAPVVIGSTLLVFGFVSLGSRTAELLVSLAGGALSALVMRRAVPSWDAPPQARLVILCFALMEFFLFAALWAVRRF